MLRGAIHTKGLVDDSSEDNHPFLSVLSALCRGAFVEAYALPVNS